jgi:hypothetical protein
MSQEYGILMQRKGAASLLLESGFCHPPPFFFYKSTKVIFFFFIEPERLKVSDRSGGSFTHFSLFVKWNEFVTDK